MGWAPKNQIPEKKKISVLIPAVIVISGEKEFGKLLTASINLILSESKKYKDGKVQSVSRTASTGYSENLSEVHINVKNIFDYVQNEFTEYAKHYHDLKKKKKSERWYGIIVLI